MKIYIVILHFGELKTTADCLASLREHEHDFTQVILVNNDSSLSLASSDFAFPKEKLRIINNTKNFGFAAGVNIGIKKALAQNADYVFLLNNDTTIEKDFLKTLVVVAEKNKRIGIVGPAIVFTKDGKTVYDLGGYVNSLLGRTYHNNVEAIPRNCPSQIVPYISGCCMLIKREVFEQVGFFDETFFLYYEDVDFCLRAKAAGFLSAVLPAATIYHALSKAKGNLSAFSVYHQTRSGVLFGRKYCRVRLLNLGFLFAQSCLFFLKNRRAGMGAFKGLLNGLRDIKGF